MSSLDYVLIYPDDTLLQCNQIFHVVPYPCYIIMFLASYSSCVMLWLTIVRCHTANVMYYVLSITLGINKSSIKCPIVTHVHVSFIGHMA